MRVLGQTTLARGTLHVARGPLEESRALLSALGNTLELERTERILASLDHVSCEHTEQSTRLWTRAVSQNR